MIKRRIKPNEELYGDYELIPLNLDAVQQRIDFFENKVSYCLDDENYDSTKLNEYHKYWTFWQGIKDEHCELDV